jgi:basic amino acid/polyamine antiporter, APA family
MVGNGNADGGVAVRPKLKRSLGLWMATALVIGNMVGSGVFLLPAALAGEAGPASISRG